MQRKVGRRIASIMLCVSLVGQSMLAVPLAHADTTVTTNTGQGTTTVTTDDKGGVTDVVSRDANGRITHHLTRTYGKGHTRVKETIEDFDPQTGISEFETIEYDGSDRMISDELLREDGDHKLIRGYKKKMKYNGPADRKGTETEHSIWNSKDQDWIGVPSLASNLSDVSGLLTAEVVTEEGNLRLNLPDDMAAGDTITGTVLTEPKGKDKDELSASQNELNGYVVEMAGQKTNVAQTIGKWLIPAAAAGAITFAILDKNGNKVGEQSIPVQPAQTIPKAGTTQPSDYTLPSTGQTGKPVTIRGPFSGDATGTTVKIGDSTSPILAESPRQAITISPKNVTGTTEIHLTEQNVQVVRPFRNVGVGLTIGKAPLKSGERTTLSLAVTGLNNLELPLELKITNVSSGVAMLIGGNVQTVKIAPSEVSATGTCVRTFGVLGEHPGSFIIAATLLQY